MGKMTNVSWVVYGQVIYQPKLVILTNFRLRLVKSEIIKYMTRLC